MLKAVGASGQISLGKKYAGKLFSVDMQPDGAIVMRPVKVVPAYPGTSPASPASEAAASDTKAWAESHAADIDKYNAWAEAREPYSQRVRRWRKSGP